MSLRDKFLSYTEVERSAEEMLKALGPGDQQTIYAFEKANKMKREILNRIEELERLVGE